MFKNDNGSNDMKFQRTIEKKIKFMTSTEFCKFELE